MRKFQPSQELSNRYSNVCCYQNEKSCGVSYIQNYGLKVTKMEYILFGNSDDRVSGKYVEELLDAVQQNPELLVFAESIFEI